MAAGDLALRVLISANAGSAISAIGGLGGAVGGIFKDLLAHAQLLAFGLKNIGTAGVDGMGAVKAGAAGLMGGLAALAAILALVAVVAAVAIGTVAVKAAADFQQGLNRLVTGAGDATDNMAKLGDGILAVSNDTGILTSGTDGLNAAMYQIISSGERGAQALDTLKVASEGAQVEQANVVDVANLLTTAVTDYGTKQYNATQYMNGFVKAVSLGRITLEQFSVALSPLLPLAHQYGISVADMSAAMSVMTNAGIPSARAATSLRFAIQSLEVPTTKSVTAMKKWGLNSVDVANEMKKSLPDALEMIYKAALKAGPEGSDPFNKALSDMSGGSRSLQAVLALTGGHLKDFKKDTQSVTDAMKASKDAVKGWDVAQSGFNVQMDKAKASIQSLLINIGTQLLPILTQIVQKVAPVIQQFADWVIKNHVVEKAISGLQTVWQGFSVVLGWVTPILGALVTMFMNVVTWVQRNQSVMDALKWLLIIIGGIIAGVLIVALLAFAVILIGIAVGIAIVIAVIWGIIWVINHWGDIMHWIGGIFSWLGGVVRDVFTWIKNTVGGWFSSLGSLAQSALHAVGGWFSWLGTQVRDFITGAKNLVGGWFSWLGTQAHSAVTTVGGWFTWLKNAIQTVVMGLINGFLNFFLWLYAHNYYVQNFVDNLVNGLKQIGAFFSWLGSVAQTVFTAIKTYGGAFFSWLGTQGHDAVTTVGDGFDWLGTHVRDSVTGIKNFVGGFFSWLGTQASSGTALVGNLFSALGTKVNGVWTSVRTGGGNFFSRIGSLAHAGVTDMGNLFSAFGTKVNQVWTTIRTAVGGFFSWLGSFAHAQLNNIGAIFSAAGAMFMQMLANGIRGAIGLVTSAASAVASGIKSFLGFHSPTDAGPGHDADTWSPALVALLTSGLIAGIPHIAAASQKIAAAMNPAFATRSTGGNAFSLQSTGVSGGYPQSFNLTITLDGKKLTEAVGVRIAKEVRVQAGVKR